jgi:uncharacterized protein involved in type VI secretion and phage assembly
MVVPRVGMEVIVAHPQGDPDTPILTGRVYNGINAPPSPLTEDARSSKSNAIMAKASTKSGPPLISTPQTRLSDAAGR